MLSRILSDTSLNYNRADTIIRKKQGLFKRIFNAKNDTLVSRSTAEQLNVKQMDAVYRNVEHVVTQNEKIFQRNLHHLRGKFLSLHQKERQLIQANYRLLNDQKNGIDNLKEREQSVVRNAQEQDLAVHKENAGRLERQLIAALCIMLLMIVFILFYQYNAAKYERKLQAEKEYAARVAEEKTSVLASVSHEVRAPINSLMGIIDILKKDGGKPTINREYLDSVAHEIAVINTSVNDILNLSKLEVGALAVKNEYFGPKRLLEDIVGMYVYQAKKKGIALEQEVNIDQRTEIYSSPFRLKQIVSNLVSNAIKYTQRGTVKLSAFIEGSGESATLIVKVKDTGIGIKPEHQKHIFRQYYMADNKLRSTGFGLGLYISKLLSEQLHGDISLVSTPRVGSTFTLTIPITDMREDTVRRKPYTLADLPKDLRLVLIDDNRINILYLKHYFKDFPNVYTFDSGESALKFMQSTSIDVVITDVLMPDINGWDVLKEARQNDRLKTAMIIAFTSDTMHVESVHNTDAGMAFDGVITKPLDEQQLVSLILSKMSRNIPTAAAGTPPAV